MGTMVGVLLGRKQVGQRHANGTRLNRAFTYYVLRNAAVRGYAGENSRPQ